MRMPLVSAFFPEVTQQIHSFRASDVRFSHTPCAIFSEPMAFLKSLGSVCIEAVYPTATVLHHSTASLTASLSRYFAK